MEQIAILFESRRHVYSVTDLNAAIRGVLDQEFGEVWVAGEISGCKTPSSGHFYFTLKDQAAQIRCVCYRMTARFLKFKPQDNVAVIARGRMDVYDARGDYQLIVDGLEPQGYGALQLAFEQLKKKLAAEGLFEAARKRPLPTLPRRIGIVTSATGSVIRDMLQVFERRHPGLHIRIYPAQVQGDGSVEAVCRGVEYFSAGDWAEVLVVARGGGSLEDLWTFNEEAVARAIAASSIPVVSAIGHETDFTMADFVADLRAPTPSAAAEMIVCTQQELADRISNCRMKLTQAMRYAIAMADRRLSAQGINRAETVIHRAIGRMGQRTDELTYRLQALMRNGIAAERRRMTTLATRLREHDIRLRFSAAHLRIEKAEAAMARAVRLRLTRERERLAPLTAHLSQLSPLKILERGYAIVENDAGEIIKSAQSAPPGTKLDIRLASGRLTAQVTKP